MKLIIESTTKIVKLNGSVMPCDEGTGPHRGSQKT